MAALTIPADEWGADHASLLVYVETRVVDYRGRLDRAHLRLAGAQYPTRLKEGAEVRPGHTDVECLSDLAAYGLIEWDGAGALEVRLTELGWKCAHRLRRRRADRPSQAELGTELRQAVTGSSS